MTERIRAFVALPAPEPLCQALGAAQSSLLERAAGARQRPRAARPDQLHLTLKFLGDVAPGQVAYLESAVANAASQTAVNVRLTGLAGFPAPHKARVLVAELDDSGGGLAALAAEAERAAISVGVPAETRAFRPHITIARLRQPANASYWLEAPVPECAPCQFDRIVLYRSILKPSGPEYVVLTEARLGAV
jgi:2'-5' RNA ligase